MGRRWTLILPLCGLLCFAWGTYSSVRWNRAINPHRPSQYFYWSTIRLDSDPLNKHPQLHAPRPCAEAIEDCVAWDPESILIHPGVMAQVFFASAIPAFALGMGIVRGLAQFGISEVASFMVTMPIAIISWFYFLGWATARLQQRRRGAAR